MAKYYSNFKVTLPLFRRVRTTRLLFPWRAISPNVFQLLTLRPPKRTNLSVSEGSSAGAMWVSGMSEASVANPDEGAEQCEATEELQLRC